MRTIKFMFGSHCHQPVGNFDHVFEMALRNAYEPFMAELERHPGITMSFHFSGCLLEWLEQHRPDFLDRVAAIAATGRLELLGSGFYEPVLAALPERDRRGQLAMMNEYIEERFKRVVHGAWMTERVWEPQVVSSLLGAGLGYVVIDDYHFTCAGLKVDELDGYYVTETDGEPLAVFPISERLRYAIPFEAPEKTIEVLRAAWERGVGSIVMMDDGEKFGLWPNTYDHCYTRGWLRRFFELLQENADWLELTTPARVMAEQPPRGTVYLPTASYFEMSEWTLPAEQAEQLSGIVHELEHRGEIGRFKTFLRGGIWRNFFGKYPESDFMHKRMLSLSKRLDGCAVTGDATETARRELYRAQCNCAYWHGVFGGLYLPHLRDAVYRHLLRCERALDEAEYPHGDLPATQLIDINMDGVPEVMLRHADLSAIFLPRAGGALAELDWRPADFNLINTLASRREGYHAAMLAEAPAPSGQGGDAPSIHDLNRRADDSMRAALHYDWHPRRSFMDHFLHADTTLEAVAAGRHHELGDFVTEPWSAENAAGGVLLKRDGHLWFESGPVPLTVERLVRVEGGALVADYTLTPGGNAEVIFAPEFNFSLLGGDDEEICYVAPERGLSQPRMRSIGSVDEVLVFGIDDRRKGLAIRILLDRAGSVWYVPAQTVSQSESGFELNYQSSVVMPHWRLTLAAGVPIRFRIALSVAPLSALDSRQ